MGCCGSCDRTLGENEVRGVVMRVKIASKVVSQGSKE